MISLKKSRFLYSSLRHSSSANLNPIDFPQLFPSAKVKLPQPKFITKPSIKTVVISAMKLQEKIALINAYISSGELPKAEIAFNRILRTNAADVVSSLNISVINAFIQSHLTKIPPNITRAEDWYKRCPEIPFTPNETTFALLIHQNLSTGNLASVDELLSDMDKYGIHPSNLLSHEKFKSIQDFQLLQTYLSKHGKLFPEKSPSDSNKLIISAMDDLDPNSQNSIEKSTENLHSGQNIELKTTNAVGVKILKKALHSFEFSETTTKYDQQIWLEERAHSAALEQQYEENKKLPDSLKKITHIPSSMVLAWNKTLTIAIDALIDKLSKGSEDDIATSTFLKLLPTDTLSRIVITELLKNDVSPKSENGKINAASKKASKVMFEIGSSIEREYNLQQLKKNRNKGIIKNQSDIHKLHSDGKLFNMTIRKVALELEKENSKNINWIPVWPITIKIQVGSRLLAEIVRVATIILDSKDPNSIDPDSNGSTEVPAFHHVVESQSLDSVKVSGFIQYHPALLELILNQPVTTVPWSLPMIVPPRPWITWTSGGYLQHRIEMVRTNNNPEHREYLEEADKKGHLNTILKALDVLGMTPWVINKKIFDIAAKLWNDGNGGPSLPVTKLPAEIPKQTFSENEFGLKKKYDKLLKTRNVIIQNNFSQRCDVNYKIEVAKAFLNETIYFPHNIDFRGRAYPIPPHLNHLGNDLCRGLLLFEEGKPLGNHGLRWLKIQISSLMGNDKVSFDDRVLFTENNLEKIFDSADKPFDGNKWWLEAENPWQFLASCIELTNAIRSGSAVDYVCRLPIHQDGTCNGLQHYAALGGDLVGAEQVNLVPSEKPGDIYSGVANSVQKLVNEDLLNGVPEAKLMHKRINRKLVKQTVMTNTYGVTYIGAKRQVYNRLREARAASTTDPNPLTDDEMRLCSSYITKKIFASMGVMFQGAREIQKWLNQAAMKISKSIPEEDIPPLDLEISNEIHRLGLFDTETETIDLPPVNNTLMESLDNDDLMESIKKDQSKNASSHEPAEEENLVDSGDEFEEYHDLSELMKAMKPVMIPTDKKSPVKMATVIWTTPLGLPIVQPYRVYKSTIVSTVLQNVSIFDKNIASPVNPMKQSSAFPPNFIHSLDASHMMLSALACQKQGITFASVHDSYWTHACDVDKMNEILRNAFVRLHSEEVMIRLRQEFLERYSGHRIPIKIKIDDEDKRQKLIQFMKSKGKKVNKTLKSFATWKKFDLEALPERGSFNVEAVRESKYFFH